MRINGLGIFLFPLFLIGLISCGGTGKSGDKIKQESRVQAVEKTDSCTTNPLNSYEIYIPQRKDSVEKLPLVVIIDAHGNGNFALNKFKYGAEKYPIALVASNYVKNGFVNFQEAIEVLIKDVHQKYPVNKTVVLAGFSGGARMALGFALTQPVNGLILCGALANATQISAVNCPVFSISGTDDFNFVETAQYLFQEQQIPGNLKIELTNTSHNWPDSLTLSNALGFLRFSCSPTESFGSDKSLIKDYCKNQMAEINTLKNQGDILKASLIARNLATTVPFNSDKSFDDIYADLKADPGYIQQLTKLEETLKLEISMRQPYLEAFSTKDSLWWKNEIRSINEHIQTEKDPFSKDMYRRIKGFWGIACYSLGTQAIKEKNEVSLGKIIAVYRMLEPENSYGIYFSAFPYLWKGDMKTTVAILEKARKAGFNNLNQMKIDFPESVSSKIQ